MAPEKRRVTFICLLLASVTLAFYWPVTGYDFINYDDPDYVISNPPVQQGITLRGIEWAFTTSHAGNWHPLAWISHMLDCAIYGLKPGGHHLTNLLLHTANVVLLFFVLRELTRSNWRSLLVAALFAWHPLHVESVAWIAERKDVLSAFFALLTVFAYARYAEQSKIKNQKSKISYSLALFCFLLALLSKPMAVTLPFVLMLLDYWPLDRMAGYATRAACPRESLIGDKRADKPSALLLLEKLPFFALAALDCAATFFAQRNGHAFVKLTGLSLGARVANAFVSYCLYLWKMVWPMNLAVPYPYVLWSWPVAVGAAVFLVLVTLSVIAQRRERPWLAVGWFWFLGTLVPVIGLVQVGIQSMADRYSYVPLIGIFIAIVWSIPESWVRWPSPGLLFGTVAAGVLLALLTGMETQLQYWQTSETLFGHSVQVTRDNLRAEYDLAEALARDGEQGEAVVHYQKALAIRPTLANAQKIDLLDAHYNLGVIYRQQKDWAKAEAQFRACVSETQASAAAHVNLGIALIGLFRDQEGRRELETALRLTDKSVNEAQILSALDTAYAETGRMSEAIATAQMAHDFAMAEHHPNVAAAAEKRLQSYRAQLSVSPAPEPPKTPPTGR